MLRAIDCFWSKVTVAKLNFLSSAEPPSRCVYCVHFSLATKPIWHDNSSNVLLGSMWSCGLLSDSMHIDRWGQSWTNCLSYCYCTNARKGRFSFLSWRLLSHILHKLQYDIYSLYTKQKNVSSLLSLSVSGGEFPTLRELPHWHDSNDLLLAEIGQFRTSVENDWYITMIMILIVKH